MVDENNTTTLPSVVALLRRNLALIVAIVALAVVASVVLSSVTDPSYEAAASIGFNDETADLNALGIPATQNFQPDKLAAAQAERITSPPIVQAVKTAVNSKLTEDEIQSSVTTLVQPTSNLVTITAKAGTGPLAAQLANSFAAVVRSDATRRTQASYRAAAASAQSRADKLKGKTNAGRRATFADQAARLLSLATIARPVDVVRSAQVPDSPTSPKPVRNAVLAALVGLMIALGLAFLRQALDRKLRDQAEVEARIGLPVLSALRTAALGKTPLGGGETETLSKDEDVEPFRILRTNVNFLVQDVEVKTMVVTSPLPEEGKSTVASGLAWAEAITGRRTLLVDCDLRRPTVRSRLGLAEGPGLTEFLLGEVGPAEILRTIEVGDGSQLVCITAGRSVANHAELLEGERFRSFLAEVRDVYDRVVLDSAPLLPVSDTLALLPQVDAVLLCLRLGQTTRDEAKAARGALDRFPTKPGGVVLTAADSSQAPYYVGSYAYTKQEAS